MRKTATGIRGETNRNIKKEREMSRETEDESAGREKKEKNTVYERQQQGKQKGNNEQVRTINMGQQQGRKV